MIKVKFSDREREGENEQAQIDSTVTKSDQQEV